MAKQPGVMLYFDIRPGLKRLTGEEKGLLLDAILDYGEFGAEADFDGLLGMAWDFVRPRIEQDRERYADISRKRSMAASCRSGKNGSSLQRQSANAASAAIASIASIAGNCNHLQPTQHNTTQLSSTQLSSTQNGGVAQEAPPAPSSMEPKRKKYGDFGWVKLTDEEHNRLVNDLGKAEVERCIRYVDEAAQSTGNKNKWRDWNLTIRRCSRDGWGLQSGKPTMQRVRTSVDYENDPEF